MPSILWQLSNVQIQPGSLPEIQAFIYNCLIGVSSWMAKWHLRPNKFKTKLLFFLFSISLPHFCSFWHWQLHSSRHPNSELPLALLSLTSNPSTNPASSILKMHLPFTPSNVSTLVEAATISIWIPAMGSWLSSLLSPCSFHSVLPPNTQSDPVKRGSHHIPPLSDILCMLYSIKPSVQMTSYQRALPWSPY